MPTTTHRLGLATLLVAAMVAIAPFTGVMAAAVQQEGATVEQTPESATAQPGESLTIEIAFDASGLLAPTMDIEVPDEWDVTDHSVSGTAFYRDATDNIAWIDREGSAYQIEITVQVPSDAEPGDYTVSATGIVGHGEAEQEATDATTITVDAEEPTPTATDTGADGATDTPEEPTPTDVATPTDTPEEPTPTDVATPTDTPEEPADSDEDDSADDEVDDRDGEKSKDDDAEDEGC